MSQQLAIIVMVDTENALKDNTLEGNIYLFDNMKLQGTTGNGTGTLVTAINGSHWSDGSQANEQVLNWLPYGLGSTPPTLPKNYLANRSQESDQESLEALAALASRLEKETDSASVEGILKEIKAINKKMGVKTKGKGGQKLMDVTGELVSSTSENEIPPINLTPIITKITGEAVNKKIMYEAEYGSPDMVTDGWYWSASVDSSKVGTYAYTMHIQLYKLVFIPESGWTWEPKYFTYDAYLKITTDPKVNGFTGSGMGYLPVVTA